MSVAVDTNLLLYASDTVSSNHKRALDALRQYVEGHEIVYLFWPVVMGFLRISTHPAIFKRPLTPTTAMKNLRSLIGLSNVRTPGENDKFWENFESVAATTVVRGNLVSDAHIVALMHQYEVPAILSNDRDFQKFDRIKVIDPFA